MIDLTENESLHTDTSFIEAFAVLSDVHTMGIISTLSCKADAGRHQTQAHVVLLLEIFFAFTGSINAN
jgi:hypothetical protein